MEFNFKLFYILASIFSFTLCKLTIITNLKIECKKVFFWKSTIMWIYRSTWPKNSSNYQTLPKNCTYHWWQIKWQKHIILTRLIRDRNPTLAEREKQVYKGEKIINIYGEDIRRKSKPEQMDESEITNH